MSAFGEIIQETEPLSGVVPVYGPPIALVAVPWLLIGLMLAGPFALLATIIAALVITAVLVLLIGAIAMAPYVLIRRLLRARGAVAALPHPPVGVGSDRLLRPVRTAREAVANRP